MGRVRSNKVSESNVLIKIKLIKYKINNEYTTIILILTLTLLLLLITTLLLIHLNTLKEAIQKNMSGREYVNILTNNNNNNNNGQSQNSFQLQCSNNDDDDDDNSNK
jgi:hypothetical protein